PHDEHDWDTTQVSPVFSTTIGGKTRKLVATSGKDGLLHVLDRETHKQVYEVPVTTRLNADKPPTREGFRACREAFSGTARHSTPARICCTSTRWIGAARSTKPPKHASSRDRFTWAG